MSLHAAIDVSAAATPRPTGVGRAIAGLARALAAAAPAAGARVDALCRLSRGLRDRAPLGDLPVRLYHERWSLLLARRLDVLHGPDTRLPRFAGPALVATVHDLSARRPGFAADDFRRLRERHWAAAAARAALLVTYTAAMKVEVCRELGVAPSRVAVVPLAPAAAPVAPEPARAGRPYVLVLGEVSRRKNTAGAVAAFAAAGRAAAGHDLVLLGPDGHGAADLEAALARAPGRVVRTPWASDAEVGARLAGADALLLPSRYEGFGLPVLEAFRAGVPVVASRDPSLVEVAGGAALHADADDADGLGAALGRVLADGALRASLVAAGRARVARFTWEAAAARLLRVYAAASAGAAAPVEEEAAPCPSP